MDVPRTADDCRKDFDFAASSDTASVLLCDFETSSDKFVLAHVLKLENAGLVNTHIDLLSWQIQLFGKAFLDIG